MSDTLRLVRATGEMYREALFQSSRALLRNIWIIGVIPAYSIGLHLVATFSANLGFAGGFLNFLAIAACASSMLTLLEELVARQRIGFEGLAQTFSRYFSRVITVFFIFWIVRLLLGMIVSQNPQLAWVAIAVNTGIFLVFNAIPEVIYQGNSDGMALLEETFQFVRDNLIEWFLPLAIMLAPFFLISTEVGVLAMANFGVPNGLDLVVMIGSAWLPVPEAAMPIVATALGSLFLAWAMIFRGFLFRSLARSGRRQRIFASRAGDR